MKRIVIVFIAIIVAIAFSSCEKEQLGMYNPGKKIHKIYELKISEKVLTETWTWEGDKLMRVDIVNTGGASVTDIFEYDGKFMSKITRTITHSSGENVVGEFLFSYDGKKLTKLETLAEGAMNASVTFLYEGNKVSKMVTEFSFPIIKSSQEIDMVFSSLRYVMPTEVLKPLKQQTHRNMEKSTTAESTVLTTTLTWDGNNIAKISAESMVNNELQIIDSELSYDNMNNPFYCNYLGSITTTITAGAGTYGMAKNNPVKVVSLISNMPYYYEENILNYKYENKYPVEVTYIEIGRDYTETIYYEYLD